MEMVYTPSAEKAKVAEWAKDYKWNVRSIPKEFDPVQLKGRGSMPVGCIDWWNTRSNLGCCLFPCLRCITGSEKIDSTDPTVWKKALENPLNPDCPDSMKGVWWLKYDHAPEELVTIFSDAQMIGTFNGDGTDGYGKWKRPLGYNWSRENSLLGYVFANVGKDPSREVIGRLNLKDGIATCHGGKGGSGDQGKQVIYRISDNEWWKVHYLGNPGEPGEQEIVFMYKWHKVLDKDGKPTKYWNDYVKWAESPLPHRNCGTSWFPCWSAFIDGEKRYQNMIRPNKDQIITFKTMKR